MTQFSPFDVSLWFDSAVAAPAFGAIDGDTTADVCVVGGGYTGLTTALSLARSGADVVLLEARQVGFGGSGRNAGHCTPTFHHHSIDGIRKLLGGARADRFIALQTNAADHVARLIRDHQIECEWRQEGYVMGAHTPSAIPRLERKVAEYNAVGQKTRLLDRDETEAMTGTRAQYGGWYHPQGGHLNPLGLSRGLARAARSAGARIYIESPVTGTEREGGRWQVTTDRGTVFADKAIFATGAYTTRAWPGLDRTFRIMRVFVAATESLAALRDRILPHDTTFHDGHGDIFVYKRDARDRIVASMFPNGRRGRDPVRTRRTLTARLRWLHPDVPVDVKWDYLWTGELDMQHRTIPRLYKLGPGAVAVTGLSGRGVPTGCILGEVLSDWARGVHAGDLALPLEPLRHAPAYMAFGPAFSLGVARWRDRLAEWRDGTAIPPS